MALNQKRRGDRKDPYKKYASAGEALPQTKHNLPIPTVELKQSSLRDAPSLSRTTQPPKNLPSRIKGSTLLERDRHGELTCELPFPTSALNHSSQTQKPTF